MVAKNKLNKKKIITKKKVIAKNKSKPLDLSFQEVIFKLQKFWSDYGCVVMQPYDMEVGAGTFHPATTLRSLGPKPWKGQAGPQQRAPNPRAGRPSAFHHPQRRHSGVPHSRGWKGKRCGHAKRGPRNRRRRFPR